MKLAEALILRADRQQRVAQLRERLSVCAKVQEGEEPPENPQELLAEMHRTIDDLTGLIQRINRTNIQTALDEGRTLTDALAERDMLALRRSVLASVINATKVQVNRYSRSEVRYVRTVDVGALQKQMDDLARQHRELDAQIQAMNWATDLID